MFTARVSMVDVRKKAVLFKIIKYSSEIRLLNHISASSRYIIDRFCLIRFDSIIQIFFRSTEWQHPSSDISINSSLVLSYNDNAMEENDSDLHVIN